LKVEAVNKLKLLTFSGFFALLILSSTLLVAEVLNYPFDTELEETRFNSLLGELRCPKCQNQALADSDAPIAQDLRQKVYDLLKDGKSDEEIRYYLVERYGEFISYRPALNTTTWVLWFGPVVLFFLSIGLAMRFVKLQKPLEVSQQEEGVETSKIKKGGES
jgi:cytochrome c-type biogenesis protein CcmH